MRIMGILSGLFLALAAALAGTGLAQDTPPQQQAPAETQAKVLARALIEEALKASRAAEIFEAVRRTLSEVYMPSLREMVQGDYPGVPEMDAAGAAALAKILTLMDYVRQAGDQLDVALSENRDAMISDVAGQMAKSAGALDINDARRILDLPAVRKTLDAFYATSKLVTGFSYEDSRTFSEFSAWANTLAIDINQVIPGRRGGSTGIPTRDKVVKAQALVEDILRISHLDEIVGEARRFAREVYAETAPMPDDERQQFLGRIDQFEFTYNMQRAVVIAAAPSLAAAALNSEQLEALHGYVRSPAFVKLFDLLRDAVKSATACTKDDIVEAQKAFKDLGKTMKLNERSADEQARAKQEWQALADKWTKVLEERISPETRRGLDQAFEELNPGAPPL